MCPSLTSVAFWCGRHATALNYWWPIRWSWEISGVHTNHTQTSRGVWCFQETSNLCFIGKITPAGLAGGEAKADTEKFLLAYGTGHWETWWDRLEEYSCSGAKAGSHRIFTCSFSPHRQSGETRCSVVTPGWIPRVRQVGVAQMLNWTTLPASTSSLCVSYINVLNWKVSAWCSCGRWQQELRSLI